MSFPFERLLPSSFDFSSRVQVAGVIDEISTYVKYSAPDNQNTPYLPREVRSDLRKKGLFLFAKCYEHERVLDPMQHAQLRSLSCDLFVLSAGLSLGCVPSPASSTGHLKLSDDHITLLVKAHGRAAKAFSDAGAPAAAAPLYAAAVRCWDELGDTARLQSTVPDVGYTLFAWAAKLHWSMGNYDDSLSLTERASTFTRDPKVLPESDSLSRTCLTSALTLALTPTPAAALPWLRLAAACLGPAHPDARARRGRILRLQGACELAAGRLGAALEAADAAVALAATAAPTTSSTTASGATAAAADAGGCEALWLRSRILAVIAAQADLAALGTDKSARSASKWEDVSKSLTQAIAHPLSAPETLVGLIESIAAGTAATADAKAAAEALLSPTTPNAAGSNSESKAVGDGVSAGAAAVVDKAFAHARARWLPPSISTGASTATPEERESASAAEAAAACIVSAQLRWLVRRGRFDAAAAAAAALPARAPEAVRAALWALAAGDHATAVAAAATATATATDAAANDDASTNASGASGTESPSCVARERALRWLQQVLRLTPGGERVVLSQPLTRLRASRGPGNDDADDGDNDGEEGMQQREEQWDDNGPLTITLLPPSSTDIASSSSSSDNGMDWSGLSLALSAAAQCLLLPSSTPAQPALHPHTAPQRAYALATAAAVLAALHGDAAAPRAADTAGAAGASPFAAAVSRVAAAAKEVDGGASGRNERDGHGEGQQQMGLALGAAQVQRLRALLRLPGRWARARAQALLASLTHTDHAAAAAAAARAAAEDMAGSGEEGVVLCGPDALPPLFSSDDDDDCNGQDGVDEAEDEIEHDLSEKELAAAAAAVALPAPLSGVLGVAMPTEPAPIPPYATAAAAAATTAAATRAITPISNTAILPANSSTPPQWAVSADAIALVAEEAHKLGRPSLCTRALRVLLGALPDPANLTTADAAAAAARSGIEVWAKELDAAAGAYSTDASGAGDGAAMVDDASSSLPSTSQSDGPLRMSQAPILRALIKMDLQAAERAAAELHSTFPREMSDSVDGRAERSGGAKGLEMAETGTGAATDEEKHQDQDAGGAGSSHHTRSRPPSPSHSRTLATKQSTTLNALTRAQDVRALVESVATLGQRLLRVLRLPATPAAFAAHSKALFSRPTAETNTITTAAAAPVSALVPAPAALAAGAAGEEAGKGALLGWGEAWEVADCLWNAAALASTPASTATSSSAASGLTGYAQKGCELFLMAGTLYDALARSALHSLDRATRAEASSVNVNYSRARAEAHGVGLLGARALLMAAAAAASTFTATATPTTGSETGAAADSTFWRGGAATTMLVLQRARAIADLCCPTPASTTTSHTTSVSDADEEQQQQQQQQRQQQGQGDKSIDELRLLLAVLWFRTRLTLTPSKHLPHSTTTSSEGNAGQDDGGASAYAEARALYPFPPRALSALAAEATRAGRTAAAAAALREQLCLALNGNGGVSASTGNNNPARVSPPLLLRLYRKLLTTLADRAAAVAHSAEAGQRVGEVAELLEGAVKTFEGVWARADAAIAAAATQGDAGTGATAETTSMSEAGAGTGAGAEEEAEAETTAEGAAAMDDDDDTIPANTTATAGGDASAETRAGAESASVWKQRMWEWDLYASGGRGDLSEDDSDDDDDNSDDNDAANGGELDRAAVHNMSRGCGHNDCSFCTLPRLPSHPTPQSTDSITSGLSLGHWSSVTLPPASPTAQTTPSSTSEHSSSHVDVVSNNGAVLVPAFARAGCPRAHSARTAALLDARYLCACAWNVGAAAARAGDAAAAEAVLRRALKLRELVVARAAAAARGQWGRGWAAAGGAESGVDETEAGYVERYDPAPWEAQTMRASLDAVRAAIPAPAPVPAPAAGDA